MSELYPSDSQINALSGTKDSEQEVQYPAIYESPYYTTFYKMLYRLLNVSRRGGDFRVYKDGDLTFGVRAGIFANGTASTSYAGIAGVALTNNATNSIYIKSDGSLEVATDGFPSTQGIPHLPLAQIVTANGSYDFSDITDLRGRSLYQLVTGMEAADANNLCGGSNADSLHIHAGDGIASSSIGANHLSTALAQEIATLTITPIDNGNGTATVTIQLCDAKYNSLNQQRLFRLWTSTYPSSNLSSSSEATLSITTGTLLREIQSNVDIEVISTSAGLITLTASSGTTTTFLLVCSLGGMITTSAVTISVT